MGDKKAGDTDTGREAPPTKEKKEPKKDDPPTKIDPPNDGSGADIEPDNDDKSRVWDPPVTKSR